MKNVILSAAFLAFGGFSAAQAGIIDPTVVSYMVQDSTQSKEVKLEELPDAVKATLASDAYKDWTPVSALWIKTKDQVYYQIAVKKDADEAVLKIDPEGKVIQ